MNITEDRAGPLQLMLMSSSPGMLDEDEYAFRIDISAGAQLRLHTQSYQRLFRMQTGATQKMEINMKENSSFTFLPHPSVPHGGAVFYGNNTIYMTKGCRLVWGEVFTCGRKYNDEHFHFSTYHNRTEIYREGKLVAAENFIIQPLHTDPCGLGLMEGFTHHAGFIFCCDAYDMDSLCDEVYERLEKNAAITAGVSARHGTEKLLLVRILGNGAEVLYNCLNMINDLISEKSLAVV